MYASKRLILKWLNKKLFERISARESVFDVQFDECFVWKEIWLTKDWFIKVWVIKMKNKDYSVLAKDFSYIKSKYKELLEIEEIRKARKPLLKNSGEKVKTVFSKFTWFFITKK